MGTVPAVQKQVLARRYLPSTSSPTRPPLSMSSPFEFPSPIGGVPFDSDFGPSILFAALYAVVCLLGFWRVKRWEASIRAASMPQEPVTEEQRAYDAQVRRNIEIAFGFADMDDDEHEHERERGDQVELRLC